MERAVTIVEVAPRDGLQSDGAVVPTEAKLELIQRCVDAGIRRIEATSFVNPKRVPQMADADDVMAGLHRRRGAAPPDAPIRRASFIGLVLNRRGVERALDAGCDEVNAVVPVSDTFSERNQGTDTAGAIAVWEQVAELARGAGVPASVTLTPPATEPRAGVMPNTSTFGSSEPPGPPQAAITKASRTRAAPSRSRPATGERCALIMGGRMRTPSCW
mgnify:CR=1 FL=1